MAEPVKYKLTIKIDDALAKKYQKDKMQLCFFKSIKGDDALSKASPTIWLSFRKYGQTTVVSWEETYEVYTSFTETAPGAVIDVLNKYDIGFGETLSIDDVGGTGTILPKKNIVQNGVLITNNTASSFTVGLSQKAQINNETQLASPLVAQVLDSTLSIAIVPIAKIYVCWATLSQNKGAVVVQTFGTGMLVDMTDKRERAIKFTSKPEAEDDDPLKKPHWETEPAGAWGVQIDSGVLLAPYLIRSSTIANK